MQLLLRLSPLHLSGVFTQTLGSKSRVHPIFPHQKVLLRFVAMAIGAGRRLLVLFVLRRLDAAVRRTGSHEGAGGRRRLPVGGAREDRADGLPVPRRGAVGWRGRPDQGKRRRRLQTELFRFVQAGVPWGRSGAVLGGSEAAAARRDQDVDAGQGLRSLLPPCHLQTGPELLHLTWNQKAEASGIPVGHGVFETPLTTP